MPDNRRMATHAPDDPTRPTRIKGRGAASNREGRFEELPICHACRNQA